jgi:hypothetical protein
MWREHQASGVSLSLNLGKQPRLENDRENEFLVRKLCDIELLDFTSRLTNLCQSRILLLPCAFRTSLVQMVEALSFCFFVSAFLLPLLYVSSSCFSFVGLTDDPFLCDRTLLRREQRDAPPDSLHESRVAEVGN